MVSRSLVGRQVEAMPQPTHCSACGTFAKGPTLPEPSGVGRLYHSPEQVRNRRRRGVM